MGLGYYAPSRSKGLINTTNVRLCVLLEVYDENRKFLLGETSLAGVGGCSD